MKLDLREQLKDLAGSILIEDFKRHLLLKERYQQGSYHRLMHEELIAIHVSQPHWGLGVAAHMVCLLRGIVESTIEVQ
jgi:hypothetical protein